VFLARPGRRKYSTPPDVGLVTNRTDYPNERVLDTRRFVGREGGCDVPVRRGPFPYPYYRSPEPVKGGSPTRVGYVNGPPGIIFVIVSGRNF
jgi:hypothetical protein